MSSKQTDDGGYIVAACPWISTGVNLWLIKMESDVGIGEYPDQIYTLGDLRVITQPNPFTKNVSIELGIQDGRLKMEDFSLQIFDISGRRVRELLLPAAYPLLPTGVVWDGRDKDGREVQQGVYFLKLNGKPVGKVVKVR
jgi:hypothetical protein